MQTQNQQDFFLPVCMNGILDYFRNNRFLIKANIRVTSLMLQNASYFRGYLLRFACRSKICIFKKAAGETGM
ncbi:hypothetical protein SAMN04488057_103182 [Cyclobacterium lianum]|uniref:Uncharacterized protein n=1 Tax=Cyclobacterium lianum TaxID=388280 RepID=A0A1M7L9T5_9BACT|nr:hypothetical protein SAMN04488057_103182 [Cyclobacterium lianum]